MLALYEPCSPQLSWELGLYALYGIWHERYLWHPFYRKLGQLIDLVLFFLCLLYWPCDMVIKIYQSDILIILDREGRLGLKVLYRDTGGFSSVPALPVRSLWPWSHLMWFPLHKVLTPSKMESDHGWKLFVPLIQIIDNDLALIPCWDD